MTQDGPRSGQVAHLEVLSQSSQRSLTAQTLELSACKTTTPGLAGLPVLLQVFSADNTAEQCRRTLVAKGAAPVNMSVAAAMTGRSTSGARGMPRVCICSTCNCSPQHLLDDQ